ncbi:MAG TPA: CotH kinase family protein, partial [Planctomycetota bacterium]|nr:CotH kinase family protein [Planctomycetota bacterium]
VDPKGENQLNSALPESGREYVEGQLGYPDGHFGKASVRYRGDFGWHWNLEKKSWRVKTRKSDLWRGMRWFNLIVPKSAAIVDGHLSNWLAGEMGLLTPFSDVVELWINGENRGLHTLMEQPDELLLRRLKRMPVDLYVGELVAEEAFQGKQVQLFDHPRTWDKDSINNHYPEDHKRPLEILCTALDHATDEVGFQRLRALMDWESMARFAAFRVLTQSGHQDDLHNWRLLYDPWRRGFEPLVWDANAWHRLWEPRPDRPFFQVPLFSKLDRVLARDHLFRMAEHRALVAFFQTGQDQVLLAEWDRLQAAMRPAAERDPALGAYFLYMDMENVEAESAHDLEVIHTYLDAARKAHLETPVDARIAKLQGAGAGLELRFEMGGWRPAEGLELQFTQDVPSGGQWTLWEEACATPRQVDLGSWMRQEGARVVIERPWLAGLEQTPILPFDPIFPALGTPRAVTYRIVYDHPQAAGLELVGASVRTTSGPSQPIALVDSLDARGLQGEFGIFDPPSQAAPEVWDGVRVMRGVTRLMGSLTLQPGTQLKMAPGASLIIEGKLLALGTESEPIRVGPLEEGQEAWGVLALRSHRADGSRLAHVQIRAGSGLQDDLQEFSGMFSIHDARDVHLTDCRFEDSQRVDDMVHAAYTDQLVFERCTFLNSHSDALDLDGCSGALVDSTILASG